MSTVCANCGQVFDESGKLVCPHCGADVDLTHAEPSHEMSFDDPRMASVNAIEVPDGDSTSTKVRSQLVPVLNQLERHVESPSCRKA